MTQNLADKPSAETSSNIATGTVLKGAGNITFSTVFEAIECCLNLWRQKQNELPWPLFGPPLPKTSFVGPLSLASGAKNQKEITLGAIVGDSAEAKIATLLHHYFVEKAGNPIAISGFRHSQRTSNEELLETKKIKKKQATTATSVAELVLKHMLHSDEAVQKITDVKSFEADFIVLDLYCCRADIIEVKGGRKFSKGVHDKAIKQLELAEQFLNLLWLALCNISGHAVAEDAHYPSLQIKTVIAFPFMSKKTCQNKFHIDEKKMPKYIFAEDCANTTSFAETWQKLHHDTDSTDSDRKTKFLQFTHAIIAIRCARIQSKQELFLPAEKLFDEATTLVSMSSTLATQKFLSDSESEFARKETGTCVFFLNPEQDAVWSGSEHQFIFGPAGTGKSLLMMHKALELCLHANQYDKKVQKTVVYCAPQAFATYLKKFFSDNGAPGVVLLDSYEELSKFYLQLPTDTIVHLFVDDVSFLGRVGIFNEVQMKTDEGYKWFAYDTYQTFGMLKTYQNQQLVLSKEVAFSKSKLNTSMRGTANTISSWLSYCRHNVLIGNNMLGAEVIRSYFSNEPYTISVNLTDENQLNAYVKWASDIILDLLRKQLAFIKVTSGQADDLALTKLGEYAAVISSANLIPKLKSYLSEASNSYSHLLNVLDINQAASLEWPVVTVVHPLTESSCYEDTIENICITDTLSYLGSSRAQTCLTELRPHKPLLSELFRDGNKMISYLNSVEKLLLDSFKTDKNEIMCSAESMYNILTTAAELQVQNTVSKEASGLSEGKETSATEFSSKEEVVEVLADFLDDLNCSQIGYCKHLAPAVKQWLLQDSDQPIHLFDISSNANTALLYLYLPSLVMQLWDYFILPTVPNANGAKVLWLILNRYFREFIMHHDSLQQNQLTGLFLRVLSWDVIFDDLMEEDEAAATAAMVATCKLKEESFSPKSVDRFEKSTNKELLNSARKAIVQKCAESKEASQLRNKLCRLIDLLCRNVEECVQQCFLDEIASKMLKNCFTELSTTFEELLGNYWETTGKLLCKSSDKPTLLIRISLTLHKIVLYASASMLEFLEISLQQLQCQ